MKAKHYIPIAVVLVLFAITYVSFFKETSTGQKSELNTTRTIDSLRRATDSLQYLADSFYNENYPCQIELNRFEIAFRIFTERNPKAAEEYGRIISSETE